MRDFETLSVERRDAVLHVWLSRPERRNALNGRALEELAACFDGLATEFDVRLAVLGGRGPSFCAGADRRDPPGSARLAGRPQASGREQRWVMQLGFRACEAIARCEVPTIARLHGHVIGGGLALAAACDFRVAASDTLFSLPEIELGVPLTWGATARLVHELGAARARELILLGERFDATTADRLGLLHRCVAPNALDAAVDAIANRLCALPETAIHMAKSQLRALATAGTLGDVRETDGDLLLAGSRGATARAAFPTKE